MNKIINRKGTLEPLDHQNICFDVVIYKSSRNCFVGNVFVFEEFYSDFV